MTKVKEWEDFKEGNWYYKVAVEDFIEKNYTSYLGDDSFLENKSLG